VHAQIVGFGSKEREKKEKKRKEKKRKSRLVTVLVLGSWI
jgi:hypothetical protein